ALSDRLDGAHGKAGQRFIAAPVFGRPDAAAAAKLFIVVAGAADAIAAAAPIFRAIGQRTFVFGEKPSTANLVKLSGNFLTASVTRPLGEARALVAKGGSDRRQSPELPTSPLFSAPVYKTYGALTADKKFEPAAFAAPLGHKDIILALAAAESLRVP